MECDAYDWLTGLRLVLKSRMGGDLKFSAGAIPGRRQQRVRTAINYVTCDNGKIALLNKIPDCTVIVGDGAVMFRVPPFRNARC